MPIPAIDKPVAERWTVDEDLDFLEVSIRVDPTKASRPSAHLMTACGRGWSPTTASQRPSGCYSASPVSSSKPRPTRRHHIVLQDLGFRA
jgi:hypothetical protein